MVFKIKTNKDLEISKSNIEYWKRDIKEHEVKITCDKNKIKSIKKEIRLFAFHAVSKGGDNE